MVDVVAAKVSRGTTATCAYNDYIVEKETLDTIEVRNGCPPAGSKVVELMRQQSC